MARPNPPPATQVRPYDAAAIEEAARLVLSGLPVAVPTETVYGLAADATSDSAVAAIYAAKGRPAFNPLIVHVRDLDQAEAIGRFDERARALARRWWPGPLTLVVPLRPEAGIAGAVTAGLPTVALRAPAHPAMRDLLAACGRPLAAPSANASGAISPTSAKHVLKSLGGRIPLIVDGGETERGLESTIVRIEGDTVRILRPGPVSLEELNDPPPSQGGVRGGSPRRGLDAPEVATEPQQASPTHHEQARHAPGMAADVRGTSAPAHPLPSREGRVEAPGQLASHYAPSKPLRLDASAAEPDEWLIGYGAMACDDNLSETGDLDEAAAHLFAALHRAEAAGKPRIAVAPIPDQGVGVAINDRLRRAAAPRGK